MPSASWYFLDSGPGEPAFNMALDEALLEAIPRLGRPVFRCYGWTQPAASFGYFQRYAQVEQLTPLRPLLRRPTGGGIVPHDKDWTYSLAFPTTNEWYALRAMGSYRRVHEWIQLAFSELGVSTGLAPGALPAEPGQCFVGYEQFDLLLQGKKIAGAAQRRTRQGLLIQGSVQPPPGVTRNDWQQSMCEVAGRETLGSILPTRVSPEPVIGWPPFALDPALTERARQLVEQKYSQVAYNQKR